MAHFMRFLAAYRIEPFGELREDIRTAMVLRALAAHGGDKRRFTLKSLMIDWWKPPPTPEEEEAREVEQLDSIFGRDGWEGGDG